MVKAALSRVALFTITIQYNTIQNNTTQYNWSRVALFTIKRLIPAVYLAFSGFWSI